MRHISRPALGLALAAVALGGGAGVAEEAKTRAEKACVNRREINSITALDEGHVFVKLSASRFYLFTVHKPCGGLEFARAIAIEGSRVRVCGDGSTLLSFDDRALGPMRCRIERIDSVPDKGAALDLIESRASRE